MEKILNQVDEIFDDLVIIRRHIHQEPELGVDVPDTVKLITSELDKCRISYRLVAGCGVLAKIGQESGKCIMLRADMDALPMNEETELSFKSRRSHAMHSCGHDIHSSILLGTARILKQYESSLDGCVKLLFQPDEEGLTGAKLMIEHNVLESPKVDAVIGLHVVPGQFLDTGTIIGQSGAVMAGSALFNIKFTGKGGHGAAPENAVDPIYAAVQIYQAISSIKTREVDAKKPLVLTIGEFSFGNAGNVIPHGGSLSGTIRFFDRDTGEFALRRIEEIATSIAQALRVDIEFVTGVFLPPVINDEVLSERLFPHIKAAVGEHNVRDFGFRFMSSDDFAFYGDLVPTLYLNIGAGLKESGYEFSLHHPKVIFDENVIKYGVSAYVGAVFGYLNGSVDRLS